ncbi:hypothetical protein EVAR_19675_1 [Eumeta japonica]|uniref:Uncharacterized protein n=1 Tax=Eumeta variegata TaxID=151549 RepID=A0A4C1V204_EUMVA|nr:hypothetical protein EVAR_19675_1 [Eumeta japonica]
MGYGDILLLIGSIRSTLGRLDRPELSNFSNSDGAWLFPQKAAGTRLCEESMSACGMVDEDMHPAVWECTLYNDMRKRFILWRFRDSAHMTARLEGIWDVEGLN